MNFTGKLKTLCAASLLSLPLVLLSACEPPRDTTTPRANERGQMERQQQEADQQRGAFGGMEQEEQRVQQEQERAQQEQERAQEEQERLQEQQEQQQGQSF